MTKRKKRIVVIAPGRGSYTKETLGYFKQYSSQSENDQIIRSFIHQVDEWRTGDGYPTLSEFDQKTSFQVNLHTPGEHASTLIYACAYADYLSINQDEYEVVAVMGNSMGWYLAMACAGALTPPNAYQVVQTMGSMMKEKIIGGQIIYPVIHAENWTRNLAAENKVYQLMEQINLRDGHEVYVSIYLGGYLVLAGNEKGLSSLLKELPPIEHYPFKLMNHAAFHTPMLQETSQRAFNMLPIHHFQKPELPLVDGRGKIWMPYSTELSELYDYTLNHQVVAPYDFTKELTVALKEFAPDHLVLLGPGNTLGGAIGQILIENKWQKILNKNDFIQRQKTNPFLISMGMSEQRKLIIR